MKKLCFLLMLILCLSGCAAQGSQEYESTDSLPGSTESGADVMNITADTTVGEILSLPAFGSFGRLLFPVGRTVADDMTLAEVSTGSVFGYSSFKNS